MLQEQTLGGASGKRNPYDSQGVSIYYAHTQPHPHDISRTVPLLRRGTLSELSIEKGGKGLATFIRTNYHGIPATIVDDDNHSFYAWCEALSLGNIKRGATLIHIDFHEDSALAEASAIDVANLSTAYNYTQRLRINNFLSAAINSGIINKVIWVQTYGTHAGKVLKPSDSTGSINYDRVGIDNSILANFLAGNVDPKNVIFHLDLDYFGPFYSWPKEVLGARRSQTGNGVNYSSGDSLEKLRQHDIEMIRLLAKHSGVISVATSPGFIDQPLAIELAQEIFSK